MVKPSFPAMFGSPEYLLARLIKNLARDSVPLARLQLVGGSGEHLVLCGGPCDSLSNLKKIKILKMEELWPFVEECWGEFFAERRALNKLIFTIDFYSRYRK